MIMRALVRTAVASACLAALAPAGAEATPNCSRELNARLIQWPLPNPVWELCMQTPRHSSDGGSGSGSGLDIFDVHYNGHLVLKRAHAPILNVKYAPGGCGCYRDWSDEEVRFEVIGASGPVSCSTVPPAQSCYAEAVVAPRTVCEVGGGVDLGNFVGVAAHRLSNQLVLTTQIKAGWYRYTMRWTFGLDGALYGSMGFSAVTHPCVSFDHTHHNYWRMDFDIDGARGDSVQIAPPVGVPLPPGPVRTLGREEKKLQDAGLTWLIRDQQTGRGYRFIPGPTVAADDFAVADYWFLQYNATEITDAGQTGPACAIKFDTPRNFLDAQSVEEDDVVMWVRGGSLHHGGDLDDCHSSWFTFLPVGDWSPTP